MVVWPVMKAAAPATVLTELPGSQGYQLGGGLTLTGQMPSDDPNGWLTVFVPAQCLSSIADSRTRSEQPCVFVVDDDTAVRQGLRFMLHAAGYGVEAFPSARSFLEDYDPRRGDWLLLDVRMPQMTGLELQQQLNIRGWRIPVIFITYLAEHRELFVSGLRLAAGEGP